MTSEKDIRVSETYREAATETAPEHLDRAVLQKAQRAAKPRYARSRAWTRPLAWAATIVLSVTVVLELTRVDTAVHSPEPGLAQDLQTMPEPRRKESKANVPAEILEEELPATLVPATGRAAPAKTEAVPDSRLRKSSDSPAPVSADDFKLQDKDLLRRADEAAELQYNEEKTDAVGEADMGLRSTAAAYEASPQCPEEATRDPETWLACVEELEAAGLIDAAAEQRRLLIEAFPDFELP